MNEARNIVEYGGYTNLAADSASAEALLIIAQLVANPHLVAGARYDFLLWEHFTR